MVDKYINYTEDVESIQEAFTFIMGYLDEFEAPSIAITAYKQYNDILEMDEEEAGELRFGVSVSGNVT